MRVFYVEDQEPLYIIGKHFMAKKGYSVDHSISLEESLKKLEPYSAENPPPYDFAVCDWQIIKDDRKGVTSEKVISRLKALGVATALFTNTDPELDDKLKAFTRENLDVPVVNKDDRGILFSMIENRSGPIG